MTYKEIMDIIESIPTKYPEKGEEWFDLGNEKFKTKLIHKLVDIELERLNSLTSPEADAHADVVGQRGN